MAAGWGWCHIVKMTRTPTPMPTGELLEKDLGIYERYGRAFRRGPPVFGWRGEPEIFIG